MISTSRLLFLPLLFSLIICPVPTIAYRFLHSNWQVSEDCNGPPTTMTLFSVSNPRNDEPDPGESWPYYYEYLSPPYQVDGYCGNLMVQLAPTQACCFSTIDWEYTQPGVALDGTPDNKTDPTASALVLFDSSEVNDGQGLHSVTSGTAVFVPNSVPIHSIDPVNSGLKEYMPKSADEVNYCTFGAKADPATGTLPNPASLGGYLQVYYLANGGCIEHYYRCKSDGTFHVFNEFGCKGGAAESLVLQRIGTRFNSSRFGSVDGVFLKLKDTKVEMGWTTYWPPLKLVPHYHNGLEILETILFIIAMGMELLICGILYGKYRQGQNEQMLFLLVTQCSIFVFIVLRMAYLYAIFDNYYAMAGLGYVQLIMYSLSTGLVTLYTAHSIVLVIQPTECISFAIYAGTVLVHIVTAGASYFCIFKFLVEYIGLEWFVYYWSKLFSVWLFVFFLTTTLPLSLILWKKSGVYSIVTSFFDKIRFIDSLDEYYFGLLFATFCNVGVYLITTMIQVSTTWLWSDRGFLAVTSIKVVCIVFQSAITCFLNERVRVIVSQYSGTPLLPGPFDDGVFMTPDSALGPDDDDLEEAEDVDGVNSGSASTFKKFQQFSNFVFKNPIEDLEENGIRLE